MKKTLLSSVALLGLTAGAMAADLPSRRAPAPFVAVPVFTWTGFYIGANAGYIFGVDNIVNNVGTGGGAEAAIVAGVVPRNVRVDPDGFTGGGQIGYNVQMGSVVLGIEADAAYTDYTRTVRFTGVGPTVTDFRTDMSFLGTVRGRLGFAFDRVMVYGTGGLAYGDVDHSVRVLTPGAGAAGATFLFGRRTGIELGWAAGGGVEYALPNFNLFGSSAVTLKAEALYYDLGRTNVAVGPAVAAAAGLSARSRFDNNGVIARAGINFKFGTF